MTRNIRVTIVGLIASALLSQAAVAGPVTLKFSTPTNTTPRTLQVQVTNPGGGQTTVPVTIMPGLTVTQKRDLVVSALTAAGISATAGPGIDQCAINGLAANSQVTMTDNGTGEISDGVTTPHVMQGVVQFPGTFAPIDYHNQPAVFTAGIISDLGSVTVQVSASELNFQTDGPIICQALFQRLAPRAPQYGAQINYAGDRLEVYFDPAYTVAPSGISVGSTSINGSDLGWITLPPPIQNNTPGDMNCDGVLNGLDISGFVLQYIDPAQFQQQNPGCDGMHADLNNDGVVDDLDLGLLALQFTAD